MVEVWTDSTFELYLDNNLIESKPNPYGFIPFVIFPNLREPKQFWGTSDLSQLIEPQRELNRAMSQISHILELSGNPVAVLENVEESIDIAVKPGAVWNIPEDAKAYLLDLLQGGGLQLHINYIELLYRALHDISEAPRAAFGGVNRDLSGAAMQIELYPLLQKVLRKRAVRTAAYNRRNWMILKLLSQFSPATLSMRGDTSHGTPLVETTEAPHCEVGPRAFSPLSPGPSSQKADPAIDTTSAVARSPSPEKGPHCEAGPCAFSPFSPGPSSQKADPATPNSKLLTPNLSRFRLRTVWGQVLPQDMARLVQNEQILVQTGIHSRRRAMDEVGVKDPESEFKHLLEEQALIKP
jgi:hypothetical protein